ncbi:metallophosphoesterase family protein [Acuticoccus sp.]|uniref:metallophosphoesterase family protein n=1 Tax=Acuticoccus sp. TaxID=1904378 RepID=UPI003B52F2DE
MVFRIAHLSDLHLGPIPTPSLAELASKRIFGYVNWTRNRKSAMGSRLLKRLLDDIAAHEPDHIALTGDLVNIATEAEIAAAGRFLKTLARPERLTVVPGNHDAYVPGAAARAAVAWAPYTAAEPSSWPTVARRGQVVLIGVSTAVATPPLFASGRVGAAQRTRLAAALDRHDDAYKVVLIHHPPDTALSSGRRGLDDVRAVRETLAAGCADLVLHGHTHEPSLRTLKTARGRATILGVPSASSDGIKHAPAAWAMIDIDAGRRTVKVVRRGPLGRDGPLTDLETVTIDALAPHPVRRGSAAPSSPAARRGRAGR